MKIAKLLHAEFPTDVLTPELTQVLFQGRTLDSRKSLLKRACQKEELIRLRNGLYLLNEEDRKYEVNLYSISNMMLTPSYVSLESALSHYNLIPEAVYTTTSVTPKTSLEQETVIGHFSFTHLKAEHFNHGFYQIKKDYNFFLMATPLKALVDTLDLHLKNYQSLDELKGDLRFDWDEFVSYREFVNKNKVKEMKEKYRSGRMMKMLGLLEKGL
ncbi:MAG: type IV toxin-antitoxin system AbiEi family antitoxin domain-containing protein [Bacteriovoracaceae bacterium]